MKEKSTFNRNFDIAIIKLMNCTENEVDKFQFELIPIRENIGKDSSKDDWMRLAVLPNNNLKESKPYNEVIRLLSAGNSKYPLWINMSKNNESMIKLEFSLRFRNIKTSHNQEAGHPPFKLIRKFKNAVDKSNQLKEELIRDGKLKEITIHNLEELDRIKNYILYFLVDWSGPERIARCKIFEILDKMEAKSNALFFIDCTDPGLEFANKMQKAIDSSVEKQGIGGHGTISLVINRKIVDEIYHPHVKNELDLTNKILSWTKKITNTM